MICLICVPSSLGLVALGYLAYISDRSLILMLQLSISYKLLIYSKEYLQRKSIWLAGTLHKIELNINVAVWVHHAYSPKVPIVGLMLVCVTYMYL